MLWSRAMAPALVEVRMRRESLDGVPERPAPAPYHLRGYEPGDAERWVAVHRQAERHHADVSAALFRREFGDDEDRLRARQLYVCDGAGEVVGTATAWINDHAAFAGEPG